MRNGCSNVQKIVQGQCYEISWFLGEIYHSRCSVMAVVIFKMVPVSTCFEVIFNLSKLFWFDRVINVSVSFSVHCIVWFFDHRSLAQCSKFLALVDQVLASVLGFNDHSRVHDAILFP